jgi:hypothetical protein
MRIGEKQVDDADRVQVQLDNRHSEAKVVDEDILEVVRNQ